MKSNDTLKLVLDPKDILIPSKYKYNNPDSGYDFALIGLSRANKLKVDSYILHKNQLFYDIFNNSTNSILNNQK